MFHPVENACRYHLAQKKKTLTFCNCKSFFHSIYFGPRFHPIYPLYISKIPFIINFCVLVTADKYLWNT